MAGPQVQEFTSTKIQKEISPLYHVILLNDEEHTYDYVIEMLASVLGFSEKTAFDFACKVDIDGFVILLTIDKETAEIKRDGIESYGADWRIPGCVGSMFATIEPERE